MTQIASLLFIKNSPTAIAQYTRNNSQEVPLEQNDSSRKRTIKISFHQLWRNLVEALLLNSMNNTSKTGIPNGSPFFLGEIFNGLMQSIKKRIWRT